MNEYLLVFRRAYISPETQPSTEKMQKHRKNWADWLRGLSAGDKLATQVQNFEIKGKVVGGETIEGPFSEINQSIGGIIYVKAADYNDAVDIARECPVLEMGGTVEIRECINPNTIY